MSKGDSAATLAVLEAVHAELVLIRSELQRPRLEREAFNRRQREQFDADALRGAYEEAERQRAEQRAREENPTLLAGGVGIVTLRARGGP